MKKLAKFLLGCFIIFIIQYLSVFILKSLHIIFPSPILGIIILFSLLKLKIIKESWVEDFCNFMLQYMILFFIPLFVGLIAYFNIIANNFWAIITTIFFTTTLVMVVVGLFVENVIKYKRILNLKGKK